MLDQKIARIRVALERCEMEGDKAISIVFLVDPGCEFLGISKLLVA